MWRALATTDTREEFFEVFRVYVPVAAVVFVLVVATLVVVLVRGRERPGHTSRTTSDAPRLELLYVTGLLVVAALLAWVTLEGVRDDSPTTARAVSAPGTGPAGLTVRVVAAKWNWRFEYPGGVVRQGDEPERPAVLVVPSGVPVRFRLVSEDVIHAFWIPAARYKYDAIPGRTQVFDMLFDPGVAYERGVCSEFCGQYHEQMAFRVDVRSPAGFRSWLREAQRQAP